MFNHHAMPEHGPPNPGGRIGSSGHSLARPLAVLAAVGACSLAGVAQAQAGLDAVGTFGLRANGGALHSVQSFATQGADANTVRFVGSAMDPGGAWEASWDYIADLDPNGNAKLNGAATILNKSAAAIDFDVTFEVPICPFIQTGSKMGGSCTIKLTTNANGGAISTQGGNSVFSALADGASGSKLFHGPFNMGSTGSGTAQTGNVFGAPFPAAAAAAVTEEFGLRHVFKLTDGDTALITSNLVVGGEPANFVQCQQAAAPSAPAAPSTPVAPSAPAVAGGSGPTTSSVTLGASTSTKVTISADKGTKKKAASSSNRPKSKAAAASSKSAKKQPARSSQNRPSPWRQR